jgi:hypothetical protein
MRETPAALAIWSMVGHRGVSMRVYCKLARWLPQAENWIRYVHLVVEREQGMKNLSAVVCVVAALVGRLWFTAPGFTLSVKLMVPLLLTKSEV